MESQKVFERRFSFEFFPPKTKEGEVKLAEAQRSLANKSPDFFSVTYGAGGSTQERTLDTVLTLHRQKVAVAPHLSCIGSRKVQIAELLDLYRSEGIARLVALRGDLPSGMGDSQGDFHYACDLVAFIREHSADHFHIEVAAYPEFHPQAESAEQDLQYFKQKVDAGADTAITQYFFNADAYFYFIERVEKLGIEIAIVPGIMPITQRNSLVRFSKMCGADIPRWILKQLDAYGDDTTSIRQFGEEVVTRLCERLIDGGAPGLHFYTLNQAEPSLNIWDNLNLSTLANRSAL